MKKKANITAVMPSIIGFLFISLVFMTVFFINIGITNDYLLFNLQNLTEELAADGLIVNESVQATQRLGDLYQDVPSYLDPLWLMVYVMFFTSTVLFSYETRTTNYLGFFAFLFYGMIFVLFVLTLVTTITDWWQSQILYKIMPNVSSQIPIFTYVLDNAGIILAIQMVICLVVNLVDVDFASIVNRKRKEQIAIEQDDEII